jgi:opacity protein-like surface antigen
MKKLLVVMLVTFMVCGVVLAQDFQPAAKSGAKSLNFTFAGLGAFGIGAAGVPNFSKFNPGFGVSYFLSSDAALRLGLQIAIPSATIPANPAAGKTGTDATQSAFSAGVAVDYLMYLYGMTPRVKPFAGLGVAFATNSTTEKDGINDNTNFTQTEIKNNSNGVNINGTAYQAGTGLALTAIVGAEFFIYSELSISAEYDLNLFGTQSASDQVKTQGPTSVTTKSPSFTSLLGFSAAGAMLHIYF